MSKQIATQSAYPKGRRAALYAAIGVAVYYVMVLFQALAWNDQRRFLTQLVVAPFAVPFWAALAFAVGAAFDYLGRPPRGYGLASQELHLNADSEVPSINPLGFDDTHNLAERGPAAESRQNPLELTEELEDGSPIRDYWPKWIWLSGAALLLLAHCNYTARDRRGETSDATLGLTTVQALAYRQCMASSRGYNISDFAKSDICRRSVVGLDARSNCRSGWDGLADSVTCD